MKLCGEHAVRVYKCRAESSIIGSSIEGKQFASSDPISSSCITSCKWSIPRINDRRKTVFWVQSFLGGSSTVVILSLACESPTVISSPTIAVFRGRMIGKQYILEQEQLWGWKLNSTAAAILSLGELSAWARNPPVINSPGPEEGLMNIEHFHHWTFLPHRTRGGVDEHWILSSVNMGGKIMWKKTARTGRFCQEDQKSSRSSWQIRKWRNLASSQHGKARIGKVLP